MSAGTKGHPSIYVFRFGENHHQLSFWIPSFFFTSRFTPRPFLSLLLLLYRRFTLPQYFPIWRPLGNDRFFWQRVHFYIILSRSLIFLLVLEWKFTRYWISWLWLTIPRCISRSTCANSSRCQNHHWAKFKNLYESIFHVDCIHYSSKVTFQIRPNNSNLQQTLRSMLGTHF